MPNYIFQCYEEKDGCGFLFEITESMYKIAEIKPTCPSCKKRKTVGRNFTMENINFFEEDKTIGRLAEKNQDRLSNDHKAEMTKKHNEYKTKKPTAPPPPGMRWGKDLI